MPNGLTPSQDARPSVSRRWATEPFPRSWKLSSVSSEISRTSPTVFRPAAANTFRMRAGSSTSPIGVSSGSSGVGSSSLGSLTSSSPSRSADVSGAEIGDRIPNANRRRELLAWDASSGGWYVGSPRPGKRIGAATARRRDPSIGRRSWQPRWPSQRPRSQVPARRRVPF